MTTTQPTSTTEKVDQLEVRPWPDKVIDLLGFDPRSSYVETFWLPVLGPSSLWLLRLLANRLDENPMGYTLRLREAASRLGLGPELGRHSPFVRSLRRLVQFEVATVNGECLFVRRRVPPLTRRQVARFPAALQEAHAAFTAEQARRPDASESDRAQELRDALVSTLGLGSRDVEKELRRLGFHPSVAHQAAWPAPPPCSASYRQTNSPSRRSCA